MNPFNKLHGRGIQIFHCNITIGFWNNGELAPGTNYITLYGYKPVLSGYVVEMFSKGRFDVGEIYLKDGKSKMYFRGTEYQADAGKITTKQYDF